MIVDRNDPCPVCAKGPLMPGSDPTYWRCGHCRTEVACNLNPRPAVEYQSIEWYGHRWEFDLVASAIPHGSRILEIGCGEGHFARALHNKSVFYQGVDFNDKALRAAAASVHREDFDFLPTLDAAHPPSDILCAFHVIEHIPRPSEALHSLLQQHQVRKVFMSVPNPGRATVKASARESWDYPPHHLYRFSEQGLQEMMESLGFEKCSAAFEPLRGEELAAIAQARIPAWLPHRTKCIRALERALHRIPATKRPRLGQAMLLSFERRVDDRQPGDNHGLSQYRDRNVP